MINKNLIIIVTIIGVFLIAISAISPIKTAASNSVILLATPIPRKAKTAPRLAKTKPKNYIASRPWVSGDPVDLTLKTKSKNKLRKKPSNYHSQGTNQGWGEKKPSLNNRRRNSSSQRTLVKNKPKKGKPPTGILPYIEQNNRKKPKTSSH